MSTILFRLVQETLAGKNVSGGKKLPSSFLSLRSGSSCLMENDERAGAQRLAGDAALVPPILKMRVSVPCPAAARPFCAFTELF